jgi:hypothetical protein
MPIRLSRRVPSLARAIASLILALLVCAVEGAAAGASERNACGCYGDGAGNCYCDRKAKCGCPGECEPKGCEERRQRQLEKEINAETKRAEQQERESEERSRRESASEDKATDEGSPQPPKAEKSSLPHGPTPAKAKAPAKTLSSRERHDLVRLLELYVAGDPARRGMSTDEVLRDVAGDGPAAKQQ